MWLVGPWLSLAHTCYLWGAVCNQLADLPCGCNFLAKHSLCFSQGPTLSQVTGLPAVVASCFLTGWCTFQWEADRTKGWRLFFWALHMEGVFWNPTARASLQQEAQSEGPGREGGSGERGRKTEEKGQPEYWQERKWVSTHRTSVLIYVAILSRNFCFCSSFPTRNTEGQQLGLIPLRPSLST